jgi:hypothetical protein
MSGYVVLASGRLRVEQRQRAGRSHQRPVSVVLECRLQSRFGRRLPIQRPMNLTLQALAAAHRPPDVRLRQRPRRIPRGKLG